MDKIKRIFAVIITVILLSVTVGSEYLDITHMTCVEAAEVVAAGGLTASTLFNICLFVGAVVGTCYVAGEIIDNQEEIAHAGKKFIDSVKEIPEGWIMQMTDTSTGQDYVFGSEAFELVQDTSWEVIQGGSPDNNNNDDDDDKNNWLNLFSSANQYVGNFLALGATWVISHASELYQKWVNGEEMTEAELAAIEPFVSGFCNQYDVAAQWSGMSFDYDATFKFQGYWGTNGLYSDINHFYGTFNKPLAAVYRSEVNSDGRTVYRFEIYTLDKVGNFSLQSLSTDCTVTKPSGSYTITRNYSNVSYTVGDGYYTFPAMSYSANFPVFASRIDAENYLRGCGDVTNALNYSKVYQNADWLSYDWAGQLIDPFTEIGLTLSQLIELMKALNLHIVGNNFSPGELVDLIRKSLPVVNPELLPDENPVTIPDPLPETEPVYWPSPDAHPLPVDPDPTPDPDPGTGSDPSPDPDPDSETIDFDDIVPDTSGSFTDITDSLKNKFPFSLPWDIYYLFSRLAHTPRTPVYYLPLVIERLGIDETIVIDMSDFEDFSSLSRLMLSLLYAYGLMNWTVKIVSVRKEE